MLLRRLSADTDDSYFATFSRQFPRRVMKIFEDMRLLKEGELELCEQCDRWLQKVTMTVLSVIVECRLLFNVLMVSVNSFGRRLNHDFLIVFGFGVSIRVTIVGVQFVLWQGVQSSQDVILWFLDLSSCGSTFSLVLRILIVRVRVGEVGGGGGVRRPHVFR